MTKSVTFTIAPNGERWGVWLDGFLLEEPSDEEDARSSVRMRLAGIADRGDVGRMIVAAEPPKAR